MTIDRPPSAGDPTIPLPMSPGEPPGAPSKPRSPISRRRFIGGAGVGVAGAAALAMTRHSWTGLLSATPSPGPIVPPGQGGPGTGDAVRGQ